MRLSEMVQEEAIKVRMEAATNEEAIAELSGLLCKAVDFPSPNAMVSLLMEREELGSTAVGEGVAIPHARIPNLKNICVAIGISEKGIQFFAPDKKKSTLIMLLAGPVDSSGPYLKSLARIARLSKDDALRAKLPKCNSAQEVMKAILEAETRYTHS